MTEEKGERVKRVRPAGPRVRGGSAEARRWAAALMQVLGGEWTPAEAAATLGVSVLKYYAVESRGLTGLVAGCEPRHGKRRRAPEREVEGLRRDVKRLERECARRQALLRLSQRTAGLSAPVVDSGGKKKRKRRPSVRALRVARMLKPEAAEAVRSGGVS